MSLAVVLAVAGGLSLLLNDGPTPIESAQITTSPDGFPTKVLGMPVVTVGEAKALFANGVAEGRVMAVGGWWLTDLPISCPWPGRDPLPIEGYCSVDYLSSRFYERWTCTNLANGSACHGNPVPPGVDVVEFVTLAETGGMELLRLAGDPRLKGALPVVMVLHMGDLRAQQCPASEIRSCVARAVIDRVAWSAGTPVGMQQNGDVRTSMTAEEAIAAAGIHGELLAAVPVRLGDAWTIDPRFHGVGDDLGWVVRATRDERRVPEDPSRGVDITLVDDISGRVLQTFGLEIEAGHEPARLVVQASWPKAGAAFDSSIRVETLDGRAILEAAMGHSIHTERGASHNVAVPALLEPGTYVIRVWRGTTRADADGDARNQCSIEVTLDPSGRSTLEAAMSPHDECMFVAPTFQSAYDQ